ncbi:membrane protein [Streptococcus pneumoniae]|nr:membrane protein [Streptococcus pneumoniae]
MNTRKKTQFMTMTALLTAIAILIPIVMPFKIVIPPASYTLGSHIAIFIAMFLSQAPFHDTIEGVILESVRNMIYFDNSATTKPYPEALETYMQVASK